MVISYHVLMLAELRPSIDNSGGLFINLNQKEKKVMKISKQSIFVIVSLALVLVFSLVIGCASIQVRVPTEKVNAFWDDQDWGDMNKSEQELWSFVGYTEAVWVGDEKNPPEEDMYWKQISPEKQEALVKLGYTKSFWDDGDPE